MVSCIARVEVPAAIWRKRRIGDRHRNLFPPHRGIRGDWAAGASGGGRFVIIGLPLELLKRAATLVASHALRAYDAIQLATALAVRDADPGCDSLACFDKDLMQAALAEGFALVS